MIPFWKPSVTIVSADATKFLRFPTKANPDGPIKTAINFDIIVPVTSLTKTDNTFKDETLNNGVRNMALENLNQ